MLDEVSVWRPARVWEKLSGGEKDCASLSARELAAKDDEPESGDEALES